MKYFTLFMVSMIIMALWVSCAYAGYTGGSRGGSSFGGSTYRSSPSISRSFNNAARPPAYQVSPYRYNQSRQFYNQHKDTPYSYRSGGKYYHAPGVVHHYNNDNTMSWFPWVALLAMSNSQHANAETIIIAPKYKDAVVYDQNIGPTKPDEIQSKEDCLKDKLNLRMCDGLP